MKTLGWMLTLVAWAPVALAGGKDHQPKDSVTYAKSWEAAVEEAVLLNLPIVVHSHGFY